MKKLLRHKTIVVLLAILLIAVVGVAIRAMRPAGKTMPASQLSSSPAESRKSPASDADAGENSALPANQPQRSGQIPQVASSTPAATAASSVPLAAAPVATVPPAAQTLAAASIPAKASAANDEIAASARMYAAHASLRSPEVADPDSKSNKLILRTMLAKAIAEGATPQPAVAQVKK